MSTSVHHGGTPANVSIPSPAQDALVRDIRDEIARLEALAMRASRLVHVRQGTNAAAFIRAVRWQITDSIRVLERAERTGGTLAVEFGDRWSRLNYIAPPAKVTTLSEFRERRRALAAAR